MINFESLPLIGDYNLKEKIQEHLDDLTKPKGSLGKLEDFAMQYCLIKNELYPVANNFHVFTFAGDHGIAEEGITPFPQEVTVQMVYNMARGGAAVSVMAKTAGFNYNVVDVGVKSELDKMENLIIKKVKKGTKNFVKTSAMTPDECKDAIKAGYDVISECDADIIAIGDMGIANTSSSSALYSLLLNVAPEETVGIGTGSTGELLEKKINLIKKGVEFHKMLWDGTPVDALTRVGGLEIAAMVGAIFAAAKKRIPVVIDGFIVSAAALVAMRINPYVKNYLYFSHVSAERFHREFFEREGIEPVVDLKMRLGEGTGAILAMDIIKHAISLYNNMATFSSAGVASGSK